MVIELLGKNILKLFRICDFKFGLPTVLMLFIKTLEILEYIHSKGYIHRDIKPQNFVIGSKDNYNKIYLLDYGLAVTYRDLITGKHIEYESANGLIGTMNYASCIAHSGYKQSRRDDLESLGYLMIYFLKGELPWSTRSRAITPKGKATTLLDRKLETSLKTLCSELPSNI